MPHPDMNANGGFRNGEHPDEGLLHEWLDDQLSPQDAAEMQLHIASCAECGARVAEARGLIAASRRILSALDEVPAGVIPTNLTSAKAVGVSVPQIDETGAELDVDSSRVVSIDAARKNVRVVAAKRTFNWKRAGSIAALLLVSVTTVRFFATGDDVAAPVASVASDSPYAPPAAAPERELAKSTGRAETRDPVSASKPQQVASAKAATQSRLQPPDSELPVAAKATAADAASGNATAAAATSGTASSAPPVGVVAAAPPVASALASSPVMANAPAVKQAGRADSSATARVAELKDLATTVASVDAVGRPVSPPAVRAELAPATRGGAGGGMGGGRATRLMLRTAAGTAFDSVTLSRTNCTPECETTSLHISALGVVRYLVGTGNTARAVMGQLTGGERVGVSELLVRAFPDVSSRLGNTACVVAGGRTSGAVPALQLLISYPSGTVVRSEPRCTMTASEINQLSSAIDSIAGVDALKRSVPPQH